MAVMIFPLITWEKHHVSSSVQPERTDFTLKWTGHVTLYYVHSHVKEKTSVFMMRQNVGFI